MKKGVKKKTTTKTNNKVSDNSSDYDNIFSFYKSKYFELKKDHDKVMLIIQCGDFYEVYDKKNEKGEYEIGTIGDFSRFTNYRIKKKKDGTYMSGCPLSVDLDDLKEKCHEEQYVVCIFEQEEEEEEMNGGGGKRTKKKGKKNRVLTEISTPGTSISFNDMYNRDKKTNNLMIVWLHFCKATTKKIPMLTCGLSNIDVVSGDCNIHEFSVKQYKFGQMHNYDDIETFYSIYNPSEIIFIHNFNEDVVKEIEEIKKCCTITCLTRIYDVSENEKCKKLKNDKKHAYKYMILKKFYNITDYYNFLDIYELDECNYALNSLIFNLDTITTYNSKLITSIKPPLYKDVNKYIKLRNSVLKQLNIINDSNKNHYNKSFNSLINLINKCKTPMGKRRLNNLLLMPVKDIDYLKKEYDIIEYFIDNHENYKSLLNHFKEIKDIDFICRKFNGDRFSPYDLYLLYNTINETQYINTKVKEDETINEYFGDKKHLLKVGDEIKEMLDLFEKYIKFDIIANLNDSEIYSYNFFIKNDKTEEVYDLCDKRHALYAKLDREKAYLSKYIDNQMIKQNKKIDKHENIKIHKPEKTPLFLKLTNAKATYLKKYLQNSKVITDANYKITNKGKSGFMIESPTLIKLYRKIFDCENKFSKLTRKVFKNIVKEFGENTNKLYNISEYISIIDSIMTKAIVSKKYNYCKPDIHCDDTHCNGISYDDNNQGSNKKVKKGNGNKKSKPVKSYLNVKGLRHPLVEHLLENEVFTTNDISIGEDNNDVRLIYGVNAVGKSVLMKSIGLCVFMAQVGMFVPATDMKFKPYTQIFTRIIGNDNMFKAQSTFTVEMTELCTIINNADENSLILGDELCSGTERQSAILLFIGSLQHISSMKSSCIFTTHYHELKECLDLDKYYNVKFNHMSVRFDNETDKIKYDRKLKEGTGPSYYGLEVCKGIGFPRHFLDGCFSLKDKIFGDCSILDSKTSKYNSRILKNQKCEICNDKKATEIHHLNPQKNANKDGFIEDSYHKHHSGNLINICKTCHLEITNQDLIYRKIKTNQGMELELVE